MSSLFHRIKEYHNPLQKKTLQKCNFDSSRFSHFLKAITPHVLLAVHAIRKTLHQHKNNLKRYTTCCSTFSISHLPRSATSCKSVVFFNPIFPVMLFVNLHIFLLKMQIVKLPITNSIPVQITLHAHVGTEIRNNSSVFISNVPAPI